jgi:hypothetical protein
MLFSGENAMRDNILKIRTIAVAKDLNYPASEALRYAQVMARIQVPGLMPAGANASICGRAAF